MNIEMSEVGVARDKIAAGRRLKEVQMPYTFTLTTTIPASPAEIYEAWLDSLGHSAMTGGEAKMSAEIGAEVSAWDGYISGRNLQLIPGERIVQSWRTSEFGDEHEDSIVTVVLQEIGDGTLLTLQHSNVPNEQKSYEEGGWQSNYFEPMAAHFAGRKQQATKRPRQRASGERSAPKKSSKTPLKRAAKRPAKSARHAMRAKPRAKAAAKRKGKARGASAAARKTAKPRRQKPSRRRRR
jgi:uncharacterized protein YndB with AHSA1/START domain